MCKEQEDCKIFLSGINRWSIHDRLCDCIWSVSYTHLDVYKRQLLYEELQDKEKTVEWIKKLELCTEPEAKVLVTMTGRHLNAVRSTSAGRLFDGVSAILGIRKKSTFEGEASTALEFAAEAYEKTMQHPYESLMLKPFTDCLLYTSK